MFTVAIVEDDEFIREGLKVLVQRANPAFDVIESFASAKKALERFELQHFDILLTDIEMPFLTGLRLIEALRRRYPHLPCVIITGYDRFEYAREALRLDALDYLLKPVDEAELKAVLNKACALLHSRALSSQDLTRLSSEMLQLAMRQPEEFPAEVERLQVMAASGRLISADLNTLVAALVDRLNIQLDSVGAWADLAELARQVAQTKGHRYSLELASDIAAYLEEHFAQDLSVRSLSEHFHVTPAYLGQVFLKAYNHSITHALHAARIQHAKAMMADRTLTITQIAEKCGYKSVDHFYRQFRHFENETPAVYRQHIRSKY